MRSKYEIEAQKELEAKGYQVDNKAGMGRWSKNRDFFNLFDLVAIKKGKPIRWIAIKGKAGNYHLLRPKLKEFWMPSHNIKELWRYDPTRKSGRVKKEIID